jgi:hypothetical protein
MFKAMLNDFSLTRCHNGKTCDVLLALERLEERLTPAGGGTNLNYWTDALGTKS